MPEIKNSFLQGKMNKDLDERLIPNGQYRDAMNVEVSAAEGADVGTIRNILGNTNITGFSIHDSCKCVGSIANEKTNKLYWFIHCDYEEGTDAIIEYDQTAKRAQTVLCDMWFMDGHAQSSTNILRPFLKFTGQQITGINIIDDYLIWTDGTNEPKKVNISKARTRQGQLGGAGKDLRHQSWASDSIPGKNGYIQEADLTVIKQKPSIAPTIRVTPKSEGYNSTGIFEKIFPRFCFRYKYADGEYSAFGPFTNVVFNPLHISDNDDSNYYSSKEVYNTSMVNNISQIEISDFVPNDIPRDVVQVDILYKQENSNVVYSVANIKKTDTEFNRAGSQQTYTGDSVNGITESYSPHRGKYFLTSENVHAVIAENQLLRPFDNVPRTAKAQEVSGNRIIYANYLQGYNLGELTPRIQAEYNQRKYYNASGNIHLDFEAGGQKSIKSQRDYQIGIIYGDKYGRETPVFTSDGGNVIVDWSQSSMSNVLCAYPQTQHPDWASYYKFYVKQPSGEYHNLIMNSAYRISTHTEFENKEDHLWLAFYSADRNKLSEEDYIIMKKDTSSDGGQVVQENKYKILDIQNEAPEAIAYNFRPLGALDNNNNILALDSTTTGYEDTIFKSNSRRIDKQTDVIYMNKENWVTDGNDGAELALVREVDGAQYVAETQKDIYISWTDTNSGQTSKRYKVGHIRMSNNNTYVLKLAQIITEEDANLASHPTSGSLMNNNLVFRCERKDRKDGEEFSGKFFVKIARDVLVNNTVLDEEGDVALPDSIISSERMYTLADTPVNAFSSFGGNTNWDGVGSQNNGIVNSQNASSLLANYTNGDGADPTDVSGHLGGALSSNEEDWDAFYASSDIGTSDTQAASGGFFIDCMHVVAGNVHVNSWAKESGQTWLGWGSPWNEYPKIAWGDIQPFNESYQQGQYSFVGGWYFPGQGLPGSAAGGGVNYGPGTIPQGGVKTITSQGSSETIVYPPSITTIRKPGNTLGYESGGFTYSQPDLGFALGVTFTPTFAANQTYSDFGCVVNGLEGIIDTTNHHVAGPRQWIRDSIYEPEERLVYGQVVENSAGEEVPETGKIFMHLSFFAPGKDLHDGSGFGSMNSFSIGGVNCLGKNLQGIWGGGAFTKTPEMVNQDGSWFFGNTESTGQYFGANIPSNLNISTGTGIVEFEFNTGANEQDPPGPGVGIGYDLDFENLHLEQWDPTKTEAGDDSGAIQEFISFISKNSHFRFRDDTAQEVYKILSVKTLHLYNHTPWRARYIYDGNDYVLAGDSVEEAALEWANTIGEDDATRQAKFDILTQRIIDFGKANNRRTTYVIQLNKDPRDSSTFNPLHSTTAQTRPDATTQTQIQFVENNSQVLTGKVTSTPIIWETEPKDRAELDIYYEASNNIPCKLTLENRETFAPCGSWVEIMDLPAGARPAGWQSLRLLCYNNDVVNQIGIGRNSQTGTFGYPQFTTDATGNQVAWNYIGKEIRFYRTDGSFTSARITHAHQDDHNNGVVNRFDIELDPTLKTGLRWYNCISFGDGVESERIRDDFNSMRLTNGARASSTIDEPYTEEHRKYGLIYSGLYNSNSGVNNLNQFIMAEKITKDVNPTYGSIQKLFSRQSDLIAFCEDRVLKILANKDAVFNADGTPQLVASENVLGQATPFVGEYGIARNPESFASESYRAYFTDAQRGAVLRLSMDGITNISDAGMRDYFRDNITVEESVLLGTYDDYKKEYNITKREPYYDNVIKNQYIFYGEPLVETIAADTNRIYNPALGGGQDWSLADFDNDYWQASAGANVYSQFNHTTTIRNHAAISSGQLQQFVAGSAEVPQSDTVFTQVSGNTGRIYDADFTAGPSQNPFDGWSATSTPPGTGMGTPRAYIERYVRVVGLFSPTGNPLFLQYGSNHVDTNYDMGDGYPYDTTTPDSSVISPLYDHEVEPPPTTLPTLTGTSGFQWHHHPSIYLETNSSTALPAGYDNTTAWKGITFRNMLVENSGGETTSAYLQIPRSYIDPNNPNSTFDQDDKVPSDVAAVYSSATNSTIFNGEEIKINLSFVLNNHTSDSVSWKIELYDGQTLIDPNLIGDPSALGSDSNGSAYSNIINDTGNTSSWNVGFVNSNQFQWPTMPQATLTGGYGISAWFKFADGTSNESIVIDNLRVRVLVMLDDASTSESTPSEPVLRAFGVKKFLQLTSPAVAFEAAVPDTPAVPQVDIPNWVEVIHNIDNNLLDWTHSDTYQADGTSAFNMVAGAVDLYGPDNKQFLTSEDGISFNTPPGYPDNMEENNGVVLYNEIPGSIVAGKNYTEEIIDVTSENSLIQFFPAVDPSDGSPQTSTISRDISNNPYIEDHWYLVDVFYDPADNPNMQGFLLIPGVLGNSASIHQARVDNLDHTSTDDNYPKYHFGQVVGNLNDPTGWKSIKLFPVTRTEYGTGNPTEVLRCIFQYKAGSQAPNDGSLYYPDTFSIGGYGFNGKINIVTLIDITVSINDRMVEPSDWDTSNANWYFPHAMEEFIDNNGAYTIKPEVYYKNNLLCLNHDEYGEGGVYSWNQTNPDLPENPSGDGFDLEFSIAEAPHPFNNTTLPISGSGTLKVANDIGDWSDGAEGFTGVKIDNINTVGDYKVRFNFDDTTPTVIEQPTGSNILVENLANDGSYLHAGKIRFYGSSTAPEGFVGALYNLSLTDISTYFSGGFVDSWTFTGFDLVDDNFIFWDSDNERITFNDAPGHGGNATDPDTGLPYALQPNQQVYQLLDINPRPGDRYRVKFDYEITSGSIGFYYFDTGLPSIGGFRVDGITGSGTYDEIHIMGDADAIGNQFDPTDELDPDSTVAQMTEFGTWSHVNSFVFNVTSHSKDNNGPTNGFIDNISVHQVVGENFITATLSFNEDVKGWTSFKSFIPESGVSLGNQYFTMKNGKIYQHHVEHDVNGNPVNRNEFYGYHSDAMVELVLNQSPSTVKSFKTLNYEGDAGWVVDEVQTDLQKGSISEFIKKESKWYNYIRGNQDANIEQIGSANFQGLGVIDSIESFSTTEI